MQWIEPSVEDLEELTNLLELDEIYLREEALERDRLKEQDEAEHLDEYGPLKSSAHEGHGYEESGSDFDHSDDEEVLPD